MNHITTILHNSREMSFEKKIQNWQDSTDVGDLAVSAVIDFFNKSKSQNLWYQTLLVHDVQNDPKFQALEIDLLWFVEGKGTSCCITVEVKGDRYKHTGNFFIETVSDIHRGTPGAFVCCRAEWYFYYFTQLKTLYCIPMILAKPWFEKNSQRFEKRTSHSNRSGRSWSTEGKLVPISTLTNEVPDVRCYIEQNGIWELQ